MKSKIDWVLVKNEYIANTLTLRQLAQKYGTHASTICEKAKKENWQKDLDAIEKEANERSREFVVRSKISNNERAVNITTELLCKLEEATHQAKPKDVSALKGLVASMQGLKEMGVYQLASEDNNIKVEMAEDVDDYAN